jgi:glycosyltransferase involved in cell wall biosynthesis
MSRNSNWGAQKVRDSSDIAVVIPAFNEAATIVALARAVLAYSRHVIVVDDASSDGTGDLLADLPVTVLRHPVNRGKGASLMTGFGAALERPVCAVVTLDGDGQHRPKDIPRFLALARQAPNSIVLGSRRADRAGSPAVRYHGNGIADFWISWASGHAIEDSQCGFRLYPRQILESVKALHGRGRSFVFESEVLIDSAALGHRIAAVPIPALYADTTRRRSHFRPFKDVPRIIVMVALKILARGLYLGGLVRSLRERRLIRGQSAPEIAGPIERRPLGDPRT